MEFTKFDDLKHLYNKYYSLGHLGPNMSDKFACIALTCYITKELRKKDKNITCYDVLLKICKDFGNTEKKYFLKALAIICEDFMYGCVNFLDFGIPVKEMPKQLRKLLDNYLPF